MAKATIPHETISFKNIPSDIELKEWLNTKSCKSTFIKDVLKKTMKEERAEANLKNSFLRME